MGWVFVLGLVAGLAVGALVVVALVRSTARITGAPPRALPALVVDGLRPGAPQDGVAAQRALARRLKRTGERTASGRRVAASALEVHVSPEDHAAIEQAMGVEEAETDLLTFYLEHADRSGWLVGARPSLTIVRDISLRPRQSFVRAEVRADPERPAAVPRAATPERPADRPAARERPEDRPAVRERVPEPRRPVQDDAATTDVLPAALLDQDATATAAYPLGVPEHAAPGDLLVVHGTDVRVVPVGKGLATVGRAAHNDVVVDAPGVARDHLLLERRAQGWFVVPAGKVAVRLDGRALTGAGRVEGQAVVELGRGARLRLTVEPER